MENTIETDILCVGAGIASLSAAIRVLRTLKARGAKLGVLSNKFDAAAQAVIAEHFPGTFHLVRGECPEIPRKPDPAGLQFMMRRLDVQPKRVAYVGDSPSDMTVAVRCGTFPVAVSWGYQPADACREAGAQAVIDEPAQLLEL